MKRSFLFTSVCLLFISGLFPFSVSADTITKPTTFSAGQPALASEVNANFDTVYDQVNKMGGEITIDDVNGRVGIGTTTPGEKLEVNGRISANNVGSVFTRWGNGTCPSPSTLLYSGVGFSGSYTQTNVGDSLCVEEGDPGLSTITSRNLLYPIKTIATAGSGITDNKLIKCSVCYVEGPVFEQYGSSTCPNGWTAAYSGYAMGPHYTYPSGGRECVDNINFDGSILGGAGSSAVWVETQIASSPPGMASEYPASRLLKCAKCFK